MSLKKRDARLVTNGFFLGAGPIPAWQLRSAQSPLEWLLYAFSDRRILHDAFETGLEADASDIELFSLQLYDQPQLRDCLEPTSVVTR